jgi:hypothetical protein
MSKTPSDKLTTKQRDAIVALLSNKTIAAAAEAAKVANSTLRRWLDMPAFASAYKAARRLAYNTAVGRLQQLTTEAAEALQRGLTCGKTADEIRAATVVFDYATKGLELADLMERVAEIEVLLKKDSPGATAV